jgi:hypothetical protein
MVEAFHSIIMQAMKLTLDKANVFVLSCHNEVTSIDNQSCLPIHAYIPFKIEKRSLCCYPYKIKWMVLM